MEGGDGGLDLIGAGAGVAHGLVDEGQALGDQGPVPEAAVLVVQQHQRALGIEAGGGARMLQQHEGRQAHDLGLGREEAEQQAGEPDRLLRQRLAHGRAIPIAAGGVALVEQEIDHGGHRGQPLGALEGARRLEGHLGLGDAALGPGDALLHGALADQEGAGDLRHGEAGDDAQGERDLLGRRQLGMAADEEQAQDVVAVLRPVEPLGDGALRHPRDRRAVSSGGNGCCFRRRRSWSTAVLRPTKMSQAAGSRGGPFTGQVFSARRQASWKASSAVSRSRK